MSFLFLSGRWEVENSGEREGGRKTGKDTDRKILDAHRGEWSRERREQWMRTPSGRFLVCPTSPPMLVFLPQQTNVRDVKYFA